MLALHFCAVQIHKMQKHICEKSPGVPLGGNYSVRRGSISAASCFRSPSLWPLAPSLESATVFITVQHFVCVSLCVEKAFISCVFNSQLTRQR